MPVGEMVGGGEMQNVRHFVWHGIGALLVQLNRGKGNALLFKNGGDLVISGVFNAVGTVSAQKLNDQSQQIFRPCSHDDLGRIYRKTSKIRKVAGNGTAKLRRSRGRTGGQKLLARS